MTWHLLIDGPTLCQIIAGLAFYTVGRKSFWEEGDWNERTLLFGGILSSLGLFLSLMAKDGFEHVVDQLIYFYVPLNPGEPFASTLPVIWTSLLAITGALWMVDFARLPRVGIAGAIVATTSLLVFLQLIFIGSNVNKPAGLGVLLFLALGSFAFSLVSAAFALSTLIGTSIVIASMLKKSQERRS